MRRRGCPNPIPWDDSRWATLFSCHHGGGPRVSILRNAGWGAFGGVPTGRCRWMPASLRARNGSPMQSPGGCRRTVFRAEKVEMRIRVALFIVLLANGLWSVGARACPTEVAEPGAHSHGVEDAGAHVHRSAGGTSGHAPIAERDARRGLGAPEEGPDCCRADARAPVPAEATTGSLPMGQLSLAVLSTPRLDPPRVPVLPSSARLRLGQPPPLPYARSRRPLVI